MQKYKFKPLQNDFVNIKEKMTFLTNIKSTLQMKTYVSTLIVAIALLSACTVPQGATSNKNYQDDIYYSSKDAAADREKVQLQKQREQEEAVAARKKEEERNAAQRVTNQASTEEDDYYQPSQSGNTASSSNSNNATTTSSTSSNFNYDDYYDYEYAVRLRRFHNNIPSYGYYDNFYTNSYWYTGNPYNYGTSVYLGYNFWGPTYYSYSYFPRYNWYSSWGWGYDPWYNPYYYNPYAYNFYNPYSYNNYWNTYPCYVNNYFNSYDRNSYYGPRNSITAGGGRRSSEPTMAHRYMNAVENETKRPFNDTKGRDTNPYINPRETKRGNVGTVEPGRQTPVSEPRRGNDNQNTRNPNVNNNNTTTQPGRNTSSEPPRRGDVISQPPKHQNLDNDVNPGRDVSPNRPTTRPNNNNPGTEQHDGVNPNGGVVPTREPQMQNTQPVQQPARNFEQTPSRQMEPVRTPQFEQPRNSGFQTEPRGGGSSSPSTNRPRR